MSSPTPHAAQPATPDLSVNLAGLSLKNPVVNGSGTFGYGLEYKDFCDPAGLGAIVTKSLTRVGRPGNLPYRVVETPAGVLNAIGIGNVGVDAFLAEKVPLIRGLGVPVIASAAGHTVEDYLYVAERLEAEPAVAGVELNISCPNTADGLDFGVTAAGVSAVVGAVRKVLRRAKLFVKLSPNVTDICTTAQAAVDAGADVLALINTLAGMVIDPETRRPRLGNVTGGLSGPAIKPIAVRMVHAVYRKVGKPSGVPLVGMGGIMTADDAVEFLLAGATAVGLGTATFLDPAATLKVAAGLRDYLVRHGLNSVSELTGAVRLD